MADLQKEMRVRRRVESIFNKQQDDFATLKDFGDYEEQKEDIIFNLAQGLNVPAMEDTIAAYQKQNYAEILRNEASKVEVKRQRIEEQAPKTEMAGTASEQPAARPDQAMPLQPMSLDQPSLPPAPVLLDVDVRMMRDNNFVAMQDGTAGEREAMGLVSGWRPDMPRKRAIAAALSSIFVS